MPVVNGYNITKLTIDSFLEHCGFSFRKFIIISSGTTDKFLLYFLGQIATKGYLGFPKEKFQVIGLDQEHALGVSESFNFAISLLEEDEDLYFLPNNTLCSRNFMVPLIDHAYFHVYSPLVFAVCSESPLESKEELHLHYNNEIRSAFLLGISPEQGKVLVDDFFRYRMRLDHVSNFEEGCFALSVKYRNTVSCSDWADNGMYLKNICLKTVGLFDEVFSRDVEGHPCGGGEEMDYIQRIRSTKHVVLRAHASQTLHLAYGFTSRGNDLREQGLRRGYEILQLKYGPEYSTSYLGEGISVSIQTVKKASCQIQSLTAPYCFDARKYQKLYEKYLFPTLNWDHVMGKILIDQSTFPGYSIRQPNDHSPIQYEQRPVIHV